eukprot:TRINITY_DN34432_c0_g1_i1.p1 TRINITY_DN34432_c0_g1~~TRINITY_DN34432_c0_g1_i1.p1  ORF type:complete len:494 (-),score=50.14 TRINITY_DN34432_c0_g1_i1:47-1483(-)
MAVPRRANRLPGRRQTRGWWLSVPRRLLNAIASSLLVAPQVVQSLNEPGAPLSCPYVHKMACAEPAAAHFFFLWATRLPKGSEEMLKAAGDLLDAVNEVQAHHVFSREWPLSSSWLDTCLSGYLLAIFISTQGERVHGWMLYELGMNIIATCRYDATDFFDLFGITPVQIAYTFFLLSHSTSWPHHIGNPWNPPSASALLGAQAPEGGLPWSSPEVTIGGEVGDGSLGRPLVIDVGMGLGGDTRYYLAHGFRVVALEANPQAIGRATEDPWILPFLHSGQLTVLHAAAVGQGKGTGAIPFYAYSDRPEQSRSIRVTETQDSVPVSVHAVECADLLRYTGPAIYMKIDIEEQTIECVESLYHAISSSRGDSAPLRPPRFLSFEIEDTGTVGALLDRLHTLGYKSYKVCRQSVYSPGACEIRDSNTKILGCGSGPFGDAAVDYIGGTRWRDMSAYTADKAWMHEFGDSRDWFDIHVKFDQ